MFSFRRGHLLIGMLVLLTLLTNAFIAYLNIARLVSNERLVAHTVATQAQIEHVASLSKDIETSERGFLLFGDEAALAPFRETQTQLEGTVADLERMASDTQQKQRLPTLRRQINAQLALARRAIALRRTSGSVAATQLLRQGDDRRQMSEIRRLVDAMKEREDELLTQRTGESSDSAQDAFRTFWIATGTNLGFLGLISWLLLQAARRNRALERAVAGLKRSETLRDNLSQMLVHDLRTPLTTLLGPLQLLEAERLGPLDSVQKEVVSMSAQSGQRLLGMVNGLLDISKLEAGELKLHRETFALGDVLRCAQSEVRREDDTSTAPVKLDAPDDLKLCADRDLIERVVINLLGNALKFTPADGLVSLRAFELPSVVRVEVEDTGAGIPSQYLERIFDKFGQVETRGSGHKSSTGLGLTFCKLAVEAHGGTIGVRSEVGRGSVFWFEVPK